MKICKTSYEIRFESKIVLNKVKILDLLKFDFGNKYIFFIIHNFLYEYEDQVTNFNSFYCKNNLHVKQKIARQIIFARIYNILLE
jgi:hypothetical protein